MARKHAGPWLRKSDLNWYTTVGNKLVRLGSAKDDPEAIHRAYLAARGTTRLTVSELVGRFLPAIKIECARSTYNWYSHYTKSFRDYELTFNREKFIIGSKPAQDIANHVVTAWIQECYGEFSPSTQHTAARAVTRMYNWSVKTKLFPSSPLVGFRKPKANRREFYATNHTYAKCLKAAGSNLRDVIMFLHHTGCRPQELRMIEARWIKDDKVVFPTPIKRRKRIIYMDGTAARIAARLSKRWPEGPIFRSTDDRLWSASGFGIAFRRLRDKLKMPGLCAYSFRHGYITRLLENDVDVATVAAISGNSPRMIFEHYDHTGQNNDRLHQIVRSGGNDSEA